MRILHGMMSIVAFLTLIIPGAFADVPPLNVFPVFSLPATRDYAKITVLNANQDASFCHSVSSLAKIRVDSGSVENTIEMRDVLVWPGETGHFTAGQDVFRVVSGDFPSAWIESLVNPKADCRASGHQRLRELAEEQESPLFVASPTYVFSLKPIDRGIIVNFEYQQNEARSQVLIMHNGYGLRLADDDFENRAQNALILPSDHFFTELRAAVATTLTLEGSTRTKEFRQLFADLLTIYAQINAHPPASVAAPKECSGGKAVNKQQSSCDR